MFSKLKKNSVNKNHKKNRFSTCFALEESVRRENIKASSFADDLKEVQSSLHKTLLT